MQYLSQTLKHTAAVLALSIVAPSAIEEQNPCA